MYKRIISIIKLLIFTILPILILGVFIIYTETGLKTSTLFLRVFLPGKLQITQLSGTIKTGISFKEIIYDDKNINITVNDFNAKWNFQLLNQAITTDRFYIKKIAVQQKTARSSNSSMPMFFKKLLVEKATIDQVSYEKSNIKINVVDLEFTINYQDKSLHKFHILFDYNKYNVHANAFSLLSENPNYHANITILDKTTKKTIKSSIKGLAHKFTANIDLRNTISSEINFIGSFIDSYNKLKATVTWNYYENPNNKLSKTSNSVLFNYDFLTNEFDFSPYPKNKNSMFTIEGHGNKNNIIIKKYQLSLPYFKISGNSKIQLANTLKILGETSLTTNTKPTPSTYTLNYHVRGNKEKKESIFIGHITKNKLNIGKIDIKKSKNNFYFNTFNIVDNQNHLKINGYFDEQPNLNLDINLENLNSYYSGITGQLALKGKINKSGSGLNFVVNGHGNNLKYQHFFLKKINIAFDFNQKLDALINISDLHYQDLTIKSLRGKLIGNYQKYFINLESSLNNYQIKTKATGSYNNNLWNTTINTFDIVDPIKNKWQLNKKTNLSLSSNNFHLTDLCLHAKKQRICLQGLYKNYDDWQIKIDAKCNSPLLSYYVSPISTNKPIDLLLDLAVNDRKISNYHLNINANDLFIQKNKMKPAVKLDQMFIKGNMNKHNIDHSIKITDINKNHVKVNFSVQNKIWSLRKFLNSKLSGSIQAIHQNINTIEPIITTIQQLSGKIIANILLSGTINEPNMSGKIEYLEGSFKIPKIGIAIKEINITSLLKKDKLLIDGSLISGKQPAKFSGFMQFKNLNFPNGQLSLSGKELLVYDKNDSTVYASPDLIISKNLNIINLQGDIIVPKGKIVIKDFSKTLELPDELVFIEQQQKKSLFPKMRYTYDLNVVIDPFIRLNLLDMDAKLRGKANMLQNNKFTDAIFGEIKIIKGTYKLFGNKLIIKSGNLNYKGNNFFTPTFEINAYKIINQVSNPKTLFGSNSVVPQRVGIIAQGKFTTPEIYFYSEPNNLPQTDILSYLAFGTNIENATQHERQNIFNALTLINSGSNDRDIIQDFQTSLGLDQIGLQTRYSYVAPTSKEDLMKNDNQMQESTAVVVGKKIFKKTFVKYFYDISAEQHIFQTTYKLSKHWNLLLENGIIRNALNLQYEINLH